MNNYFSYNKFVKFETFLTENKDNQIFKRRKIKLKANDIKIVIVNHKIDRTKQEAARFKFKFNHKPGDSDGTASSIEAIDVLNNMLASQVADGYLANNMVAIVKIRRDSQRRSKSAFVGGVVIYEAGAFTDTQLVNSKPLNHFTGNNIRMYDEASVPSDKKSTLDIDAMVNSYVEETSAEPEDTSTKEIEQPPQEDPIDSQEPEPEETKDVTSNSKYVNLSQNLAYNDLVVELQVKLGMSDQTVAQILANSGGIDGKYGNGTAKAISQTVYGNQTTLVTQITPEVANALETKFANLDDAKVQQAVEGFKSQIKSKQQSSVKSTNLTNLNVLNGLAVNSTNSQLISELQNLIMKYDPNLAGNTIKSNGGATGIYDSILAIALAQFIHGTAQLTKEQARIDTITPEVISQLESKISGENADLENSQGAAQSTQIIGDIETRTRGILGGTIYL